MDIQFVPIDISFISEYHMWAMANIRRAKIRDEQPLEIIMGLMWDVDPTVVESPFSDPFTPSERKVEGPYCPKCRRQMYLTHDGHTSCEFTCSGTCAFKKKYPYPHTELLNEILEQHNAKARSLREVVNLDLPPTKLEVAYDQDNDYFLSARITQRDGRRLLVVYAGEKKKGKNTPKDYSQFFIDLDQKQVRYDTTNQMPEEFLATFVAEFKDVTHTTEFKKKKS